MIGLAPSPHVEVREAGYFLAGTRISLGSIACAVRRGETVDEILEDFPLIKSRSVLEGVVEYINVQPREIEAYLGDLESRWEKASKLNPPEVVERARGFRGERALKSVESPLPG